MGEAMRHPIKERQLNQAAFRMLQNMIQQTYAPGHFLAISEGKIVAEAPRFEELDSKLHQMGNDSTDVLVVQVGKEYPETATIFAMDFNL